MPFGKSEHLVTHQGGIFPAQSDQCFETVEIAVGLGTYGGVYFGGCEFPPHALYLDWRISAGVAIEDIIEPTVDDETLERYPAWDDELRVPNFFNSSNCRKVRSSGFEGYMNPGPETKEIG